MIETKADLIRRVRELSAASIEVTDAEIEECLLRGLVDESRTIVQRTADQFADAVIADACRRLIEAMEEPEDE